MYPLLNATGLKGAMIYCDVFFGFSSLPVSVPILRPWRSPHIMGGEESKFGYQVSRVIEDSPAHRAGLLPFFDFIIAVDGVYIEDDGPFFKDYLRTHNGQTISIDVYNARTKTVRRIRIVPNDRWGGAGLLGCCIMWENIESAYVCSWHVLDIIPGSNAYKAGLQAHRDYIIGMQAVGAPDDFCTMFTDEQDFEQRLSQFFTLAEDPQSARFQDYTVALLVFDTVANAIREVRTDIPLGCDVGGGYMHTVPSTRGDQRLPSLTFSAPKAVYTSDAYTAPAASAPFPPGFQQQQPPQPRTPLSYQTGAEFLPQAAKLRPTPQSDVPRPSAAAVPQFVPNPYTPHPSLGGFGLGQVTIQLQD